jgi:hypothetical protein
MEQVVDAPGPAPAPLPSFVDVITEQTLSSPADCIDLEDILSTERDEFGNRRQLAFRGQSRTFGTLVPSFRRLFLNNRSAKTAELIESELIGAFREHYRTLQSTMSEMPASGAIGPGKDLRCLSVMQHYGVPTRLLDWTADFWTAMYFACAGDPGEDAELWCYDRLAFGDASGQKQGLYAIFNDDTRDAAILDRHDLDLVVEQVHQLTPRMQQQQAHHTVAANVFADHAPLIHQMLNTEAKPHFKRLIIAQRAKDRVLKYLNDHKGISASKIFPDFEGLGRFLRWQLDSLMTTLL